MKRCILILLASAASLVLLGWLMLFSSTTHHSDLGKINAQLCWLGLGLLACLGTAWLDYSWLQRKNASSWLLGLVLLLLVAVLVPGVGVFKKGASRWLAFGQPSELAKLALVLYLADYVTRNGQRMRDRYAGFLRPGVVVGLVVGLIFLEPDWGTAALLGAVSLAMLAVAGADAGYLLSSVLIGAELFIYLLLRNPLRLDRVLAFMDPQNHPDGAGWQGWHSLLALGNGGWLGTFIGEGSEKNGFVPEQQTDFILSLIGEELGLAGTWLVLALFTSIFLCGARIAWKAAEPFGKHLASGLTLLMALQVCINFGVVTSCLPNKGMALPFVSYGGSNLVCMFAGLGLLVSIARHSVSLGSEPLRNRLCPVSKRAAGPVGSLLFSTVQDEPNGLWQSMVRRLRLWRGSRFRSVPRHSYQRLPARRVCR